MLSTLGIATGGRGKQILLALSGSPIEKRFDALVSAEEVPLRKSYPEIYLHTLDRPNEIPGPSEGTLVPAQRLVIEDSLAGIKSALAQA
jgi:beta-phosphoglucomutase-like phosphatase (HAD superfamily)